jgi:inosine/xanthosine triphosphate pyrophosphatase family protein/dephospho-CoA kinase
MRPRYRDAFRFDRVLSVYFYTSNTDKLIQARLVFMRHGYELKHFRGHREPYEEDYSLSTEQLLTRALDQVSNEFKIRSLFFVEDTSLRIEPLSGENDFPGLGVKEWFTQTSFDELDRELKLRGSDRRATVKSDIGLFVPGLSRPLLFHGETSGAVADTPPSFEPSYQYPWLTPSTFNGWFVPDGAIKRLGEMAFEESLDFDFRVKSLCALIQRIEEMNAALNLGPVFYNARGAGTRSAQGQLSLLERAQPEVLTIIGPKCAGKTTFSDYASHAEDVFAIEASSILRELASEKKAEVVTSEDALAFLEQIGMDAVARRVAEIVARSNSRLFVVTGLRTIEELLFLYGEVPRLRTVLIEADVRTRYERHIKRARDLEVRTFGEFLAQDEQQATFGVMRVPEELADIVLRNDGTMEVFQRRIDELLAGLASTEPIKGLEAYQNPSELYRSLKALDRIGRAATCDQIAAETGGMGFPVRRYNTNRALKNVPDLATRIERPKDLLRYNITARGRAFVKLLDLRSYQASHGPRSLIWPRLPDPPT